MAYTVYLKELEQTKKEQLKKTIKKEPIEMKLTKKVDKKSNKK